MPSIESGNNRVSKAEISQAESVMGEQRPHSRGWQRASGPLGGVATMDYVTANRT